VVDQLSDLVETTYNFGLSNGSVAIENASPSVWTLSTVNPTNDSDWNTTLLEQATAAYEGWRTNVGNGQFENSVQLSNVTCRLTDSADRTLLKQVYLGGGTLWTGSATDGCLPWQTSLCISLYSYNRGTFIPNRRRRSGRFYMPPMDVGVLNSADDGLLSPTLVGELIDEMKAAWAAIQSASYTAPSGYHPLVGVNSRGPFKPPTDLPNFFHMVEVSADTKLDTQRRRAKGLESVIAVTPFP